MSRHRLLPVFAAVVAGLATASLSLAAAPAHAAAGPLTGPAGGPVSGPVSGPGSGPGSGPLVVRHGPTPTRRQIAQLPSVRDRQARMIAAHRAAPRFAATATGATTAATTFTVDTLEDSDVATATSTRCVDAATGRCSLRAAVSAANHRGTPVRIVLGKHTYTLTAGAALHVTNPGGTDIVGQGAGVTAITGAGSGLVHVSPAASGSASPLVFLTGVKLTGGVAADGAGIYLDDTYAGATAVLDHVVLTKNTATSGGGAIYTNDDDTLYATDSKIVGNTAVFGAGIASFWSDVDLENTTIAGNLTPAGAGGSGSAIYNDYGVLRVDGGSITGNVAGDATARGDGGGIYDTYGNLTLNRVHLDGNTVDDGGSGGGIYAGFDLVEVNGGSVSHNHAQGADSLGGGVYVEGGAQVDLHGVRMAGNKVGAGGEGYGGGAVYLYGSQYGNQATIDSDSSITGSNGGAVYAYTNYGQVDLTIANSTLAHNHNAENNGMDSYGCGGAVCADEYEYGTLNLTMTGNKFVDNTSTGNFGSGAVSVYAHAYSGAVANLHGNLFQDNLAGAGGYGGAVLMWDDDTYTPTSLRSQANTFVGNRAGTSASPGYGGALAVSSYAALTDHGSSFRHNHAVGSGAKGGAVYNASRQSERFTGTKFIGNSAGPATTGEGYGGAVYTDDEAGDAFSQVTLAGNRATSYGGGLYGGDYAYQISLDRSTVSGNTAGTRANAGYGGGLYVNDAVLTLENSTVANNKATSVTGTPGQGGGIYHYGSTLGLRYSTVSGNVAQQGGGVYVAAYGGNILGSIVSRNHARAGGTEQDCLAASPTSQLHSLGGNVLGQASCVTATRSGDKVSRHPHLGKLARNGGPTKTMAISAKSPAVGIAHAMIPDTDQRGHRRPSRHADAGAYERS